MPEYADHFRRAVENSIGASGVAKKHQRYLALSWNAWMSQIARNLTDLEGELSEELRLSDPSFLLSGNSLLRLHSASPLTVITLSPRQRKIITLHRLCNLLAQGSTYSFTSDRSGTSALSWLPYCLLLWAVLETATAYSSVHCSNKAAGTDPPGLQCLRGGVRKRQCGGALRRGYLEAQRSPFCHPTPLAGSGRAPQASSRKGALPEILRIVSVHWTRRGRCGSTRRVVRSRSNPNAETGPPLDNRESSSSSSWTLNASSFNRRAARITPIRPSRRRGRHGILACPSPSRWVCELHADFRLTARKVLMRMP